MFQRIFLTQKKQLFYILPHKRTLALKGEKCQGVKGCKDREALLMCCMADGNHKLHPLAAGKFEEIHCWKDLERG
jgi:hypothetical protein